MHAFEPTRWAYKKLSRNLSANPGIRETVKARQVFLTSPVSPQVPIQVESSWPLHNSEGVNSLHGGKANDTDGALSFTLDEYVKAEGIQKLNLIKIDVDGHEATVLAGASASIRRFRPALIIEWAPALDEDGALRMALEELLRSGYGVRGIGGRLKELSSLEELQVRIPPERWYPHPNGTHADTFSGIKGPETYVPSYPGLTTAAG